MPQRKCAQKRLRADKIRLVRNAKTKSELKKITKQLERLLAAGDTQKAKSMYPSVVKTLDRAARKGIISKNAASRKKSRLALKLT